MAIAKSQMIENWDAILLDSYDECYGDLYQNTLIQTVEEVNAQWIEHFMTDFEVKMILAQAA